MISSQYIMDKDRSYVRVIVCGSVRIASVELRTSWRYWDGIDYPERSHLTLWNATHQGHWRVRSRVHRIIRRDVSVEQSRRYVQVMKTFHSRHHNWIQFEIITIAIVVLDSLCIDNIHIRIDTQNIFSDMSVHYRKVAIIEQYMHTLIN